MVIETNLKHGKNDTKTNALINEYKGNLFEYLVAHQLSRTLGLENEFLTSFGGEAKERLVFYQSELLRLDKALYLSLPALAQTMADKITQKLSPQDMTNVLVVGKSAGGSHDDSLGESDILLQGAHPLGLSIKYCKKGAYINTKSAGIRSFIEKYFTHFDRATHLQQELNHQLDKSFERMARELYEHEGLEFHEGKPFDERWPHSHLPGELEQQLRDLLFAHYYRMAQVIFDHFKALFTQDKKLFLSSLAPIVGLAQQNIHQAVLFHAGEHEVADIKIYGHRDYLMATEDVEFYPYKGNVSSFELRLGSRLLQIRVKPMNVFTTSAMKINCSMKYLG